MLSPDDVDGGIWSGSVVDADGGRIFYTSVSADAPELGRVRAARPLDADWSRWAKQEGAVVEAPAGLGVEHFRDPFVLHDGTIWRMVVGAGLRGGTAAALTWTSTDLGTWDYDGDGYIDREEWSGTEEVFNALDRDNNGRISLEEMAIGLGAPYKPGS